MCVRMGLHSSFLHSHKSSGESVMSQLQSSRLNFMAIRATIEECSRFDLWSVWIFLSMEKPRSESAGMVIRPDINSSNVVIFPTSNQKGPALGLMTPSAALYLTNTGKSLGESLKSWNCSFILCRDTVSLMPICGKRLASEVMVMKKCVQAEWPSNL